MSDGKKQITQNPIWAKLNELPDAQAALLKPERPVYIVCMDDEPFILDYLEDYLSDGIVKVKTFEKPREAVNFIRSHHPDIALIMSDFKMPELTGFDVRKLILETAPSVPFVILSAFVDREMALDALALKVTAFLTKPLAEPELAAIIASDVVPRISSICEDRELLAGFIDDARSMTEQIEESSLALEDDINNQELFNTIFGLIHTLKGASSFFEPKTLHHFVHRFEDHLKIVQRGGDPKLVEEIPGALLASIDYIRVWVEEFATASHKDYDVEAIFTEVTVSKAKAASGNAESKDHPEKSAESASQKPKEIKLDISVLDELLVASGEMTVIRNMLNKVAASIVKHYTTDREVQVLSELLQELHEINADVQSKVVEVRKVSMRAVLKPVPRVIRDVSKLLGKDVEFVATGQDQRIDNSIADVLNGCLLHIVKNSLDHGLEKAEVRTANGKPARGRIEISTKASDDLILVKIEDDGGGINAGAIRKKMIDLGWSAEKVNLMTDEQVYPMIFESGLSTSATTTEISGRGVGMSMVKQTVEEVGGRILIDSVRGRGTKFTLELPVPKSVSIVNCLFIQVAGRSYGIRQDQILRVYKSEEDRFHEHVNHLEGASVLRLDNELYPIVFANKLLHGTSEPLHPEFQAVLLKTTTGLKYALVIDGVEEFEDTVIKQVAPVIKSLGVFSGATFLGDGNVGLLLDVDGIVKRLDFSIEVAKETKRDANMAMASSAVGSEMRSWVVFELDVVGQYAFPESEVFRIEEFKVESLQRSGQWAVIPYRGQVMPVLQIDMPGIKQEKLVADKDAPMQVLVLKNQDRYQALHVRSILDIIATDAQVEAPMQPIFGVNGNLIYKGKTLTILDPQQLLNAPAESEHESSEDQPSGFDGSGDEAVA